MRLIKLTANRSSFHPVEFNKTGLTLVVGKQKTKSQEHDGKTYNGVGKSLLITLIHFCLGANKNKELERAIPDWEFSLEFEIDEVNYTTRRNASSQNKIFINDQEMGVKKFGEFLLSKLFYIEESKQGLTFRPLIHRFIRPRKASYVSFDSPDPREKPYEQLLRNAYLLGINTNLVQKKRDLVLSREKIKEFRKNLEEDTIFNEFFTGYADADIELKDLDEKIEEVSKDIVAFRVADNYAEIQQNADKLDAELFQLRNRVVVVDNAIKNIEKSLEQKTDIPIERIQRVYDEAKTNMPESVIKQVEDVIGFHADLMQGRVKRLSSERSRLENEKKESDKNIKRMKSELNDLLAYLGEHGALDEFAKISNYAAVLKNKAQKIRDYKELLSNYSEQVREINSSLITETEKTEKYLDEAQALLDKNLSIFRSFSKQFYPDKPGGLTVHNNDGDNQIRFTINAKIQDDASDGINEVKIFCFDMTIITTRHNHKVNCIVHDSRLFSDIDYRQRAKLFKIASQYANEKGFQYIATVNEDQIASMRNQFDDEEYKYIIEDNIALELTDQSPKEKLLGIQVDMNYEK